MSKQIPITKYLEQQRQQWNRNKSLGGPQTAKTNTSSKPLQDKPPMPVSATTKNKLSNFQFGGQANADSMAKHPATISLLSDDEKENSSVMDALGKPSSHKKDVIDADGQPPKKRDIKDVDGQPVENRDLIGVDGQSDRQKDCSKSSESLPSDTTKSEFPSTPATRLALPDLIGMEDVRRVVQEISPEDRIEWDRHSSASSSFGIRRAKKRARSSSPISSPVPQNHLNLQVDPGSELWSRYSLNSSNAPTPQGATIPALAHIMQTSSPQPSKDGTTPRSVAGFRRTTSCGTQFPKRRRVGGTDDDDVFTESAEIGPSKLSVLIERVQEGFAQPKQSKTDSGPSVSPVLENVSSEESENCRLSQQTTEASKYFSKLTSFSSSYPELLQRPIVHNQTTPLSNLPRYTFTDLRITTERESPPPRCIENQTVAQSNSNGSDYGDFDDDDLDDAPLLEVLSVKPEVPAIHISHPAKPKLPPDPPQRHPEPKAQYPSAVNAHKPSEMKPKPMILEDDEFDDSDEDLFAAGLEDMVAIFDKKPPAGKVASVTKGMSDNRTQKKTVPLSDSDDEFGDDGLNDLDFEVAEKAATQSVQQASNSLLPVRSRFP
jgi:hypothetical protein